MMATRSFDVVVIGAGPAGEIAAGRLTMAGREVAIVERELGGERRVRVGDEVLEAREAVIVAIGTTAAMPPIAGLADSQPWTNREVTTASEIPEHLVVLGGGVVGVEMAQAWRSLSSRVTVIEASDRLLAREEPFAGEEVAASLIERGALEIDADQAFPTVGLEPGRSIEVDDTLRVVGLGWLYAVGDVNGRALLTHMGKYQARVAADRILGDSEARIRVDGPLSPRVFFTDPQVAATGHTLASALAAGICARAVDLATSATAGASFVGRDAAGTTRFVVDTEREVLVGVTFVGPEVADFLHAATIARPT